MSKELVMRNAIMNRGLKNGVRVACDEKTMKYIDMGFIKSVNDAASDGEVVFMCADEYGEYAEVKNENKSRVAERAYRIAEAIGKARIHCHHDRDYRGLYGATVSVIV
ncbi:MAG: hypothetical protein LUD47_07840 [Clostridia bacterium]|nr:hypothetical protein [Clostridia bacterium]